MSNEREVHHEDEMEGIPRDRIVFVEDEMTRLFDGQPCMGKTNALDKILQEWLAAGRKVETAGDIKADPELARLLAGKRAEITEAMGDAGFWQYPESGYLPGEHMTHTAYGSMIQRPYKSTFRLPDPEFPVRVGDVVRIIDVMWGDRPVPGHVVDINGWWITVAGPLGRKVVFSGQTGFQAIEYRWRLEPYFTEEESNR